VRYIILAVDDSASMRRMVAHVLRHGGYEVLEAADGEEALAIARSRRVDAVLTDHHMAKMDGIALVRHLRALDDYKRVPVMLLTTESAPELKQLAREAGASGWMVKPFDPERLVEMFEKLLGARV
jgi:two-component system chemotaxis response regulator CheY